MRDSEIGSGESESNLTIHQTIEAFEAFQSHQLGFFLVEHGQHM